MLELETLIEVCSAPLASVQRVPAAAAAAAVAVVAVFAAVVAVVPSYLIIV